MNGYKMRIFQQRDHREGSFYQNRECSHGDRKHREHRERRDDRWEPWWPCRLEHLQAAGRLLLNRVPCQGRCQYMKGIAAQGRHILMDYQYYTWHREEMKLQCA